LRAYSYHEQFNDDARPANLFGLRVSETVAVIVPLLQTIAFKLRLLSNCMFALHLVLNWLAFLSASYQSAPDLLRLEKLFDAPRHRLSHNYSMVVVFADLVPQGSE
jgi:hypothetical protein